MAKATKLKMNDGFEIPILGLGTYARESNTDECRLAVESSIACGYRHIDTATFYNNEEEIGKGIDNVIKKGVVTREELFITTKLWNDQHEEEKVVPALKDSLKKLNLAYVDLYLIHWPLAIKEDGSSSDVDYLDTWKGMEKCKELGLAKSIGVSNFNIQQLERLLANTKTVPVINQVEVNPNLTQKKLLEFCKSKNILLTAYTPLGSMPQIRNKGNPLPAPQLDDPILSAMAEKYKKTTIQIVLRYLIDCGIIAIPKSVTPARIVQNIDVFDFTLTPEEIKKIDEFNADYRVVQAAGWKNYKNYPF